MSVFYLGAHQPHWLWQAGFPLFVSHRALTRRRSLRPGSCRWALDSGGFTELSLHGRWITPPEDYAAAVTRYAGQIGGLDFAAPQDWMCEPVMLTRTGLPVAEHQHRTVANYLALRQLAPYLPFIPVVQGWRLADYLACVDLYASAGVDLAALPRVGLGSVCRRQSTAEIAVIVTTLAARGVAAARVRDQNQRPGPVRAPAGLGRLDGLELRRPPRPGPARLHRAPQLRQLPDLRHRLADPHPGRRRPRLAAHPVRPPATLGGGRMTTITTWRTDEPCPVCATGLIMHDDGTSPVRVECRLCGWADTWTSDHPAGGDQ